MSTQTTSRRPRLRRADWLVPTGLITLSLVPALAGTMRVVQLAGGAEVTAANARFFDSPVPVLVHIVSVTTFSLLGAVQFSGGLRRRHPGLHRRAGRILVPAGLTAALSGLWMTQFYELPAVEGTALHLMRWGFGSAMVVSLLLGTRQVLRRDFVGHRAWMIRGYAIGMGAGTQVLTHLPWVLFPNIQGETTKAVLMGAGWAINLAIAEAVIGRRRR